MMKIGIERNLHWQNTTPDAFAAYLAEKHVTFRRQNPYSPRTYNLEEG